MRERRCGGGSHTICGGSERHYLWELLGCLLVLQDVDLVAVLQRSRSESLQPTVALADGLHHLCHTPHLGVSSPVPPLEPCEPSAGERAYMVHMWCTCGARVVHKWGKESPSAAPQWTH